MPPTLRRRQAPDSAETSAETGADAGADARADARADVPTDVAPARHEPPRPARRRTLAHATPVLLLRAAHPRQALLTAGAMALAAALTGRAGREVALVLATVLVGQAVLGWHNDLVDRTRDASRLPSGKPIADGYLDPGTAWFALACGVLLVVPLAVQNGVTAGATYLASLAVGLVANVVLRRSWLSFLPWAVAFALYPYFLAYGGWGGDATGEPPQVAIVALAAAVGVGVHVLCALPGLVADHEDGVRSLPLRIAMRTGATRLLVLALAWTVLALVAILVVGNSSGLSQ